ncbi:ComF family protein [Pseudomonas syringae pv. tagetis]|uniref:ComF family protein n=2 Tax=Pseudomonas syringae group genomosp. 7 TaxID=251699 RepID=A0A0Q0BQK1_9PSED|nr:ComF family protein [Pseudomonas syringae group genomosp. 7]KPX46459.1 Competence protein ComF [Pseudomonas syringae pv. helianthi]KPY80598.1 Phosphoribosyltransferase [Pseudomonas syringae pv. tagetis]RMR10276.1 Competence protein ComF [Pseudomonas syringae pv. helianthi]RMV46516.1 Phosphoribosyltransferase [Pseudomonas syringae pv. helianthi]RMW12165.1 Competence protein ComF [Pseudomonas syringae pv. tagetis]
MRCQPNDQHEVYIWLKNKQSCLLCDERSEVPVPICVPCEAELPWLGRQCKHCALPLTAAGLSCAQCCKRLPGFAQVITPWLYDFPVDSLITRFKHNGKWPMGRLLAELCGQFLQHRFEEDLPRPDYLIPVPLASKRLRQRGYNQAAMLARWLGKQLQLPVDEHHVLRNRETTAQQGLNAKARKRNLRDAFTLIDPDWVQGRHLALVDDVLTTGSTAEVIARLLNNAGARRVDVYCLARTPRPGD